MRPYSAAGLRLLLVALATTSLLIVANAGCRPRPPVSPVDEVTAGSSGISLSDQPIEVALEASWPWWRGPNGNGHAIGEAPTQWSSTKNVEWQVNLPGRGHSSPIVCGEAVYVATADDRNEIQSVLAVDRNDGAILWETTVHEGSFPPKRDVHHKATNANGTIACDGDHLFIAFLNGGKIIATALNLKGDIVWQEPLGSFNSKFGYAPSPTLYQSSVIFAADNQGGGHISSLDRNTGKTIWRKQRPAIATYSSPIVASVGGTDQLLISGAERIVSLDPATGNENWSCPGTAEATCGTIVTDGERIFASGGHPQQETLCVDAKGKKVWSESVKAYEPSMLYYEGAVYAVKDDGIGFCWDAKTGKELWKARVGQGDFSASPVVANDIIYVSNDKGTTYLFEANTKRFKLTAENKLGDDCYASPAICDGRVYLRVGISGQSRQEILYCIAAP
jgi:outer membrane protein assembly factor BamB